MSVKDKIAAIDRFVRTIKESGVYDDVQAACIMAGWTNLAGALTPLKGAAPTNSGFLDADLDAGIGLKGNGSSKYLSSNRAEDADPQNDAHISSFSSSPAGSGARVAIGSQNSWIGRDDAATYFRRNQALSASIASPSAIRFLGASRDSASGIAYRINGATYAFSQASVAPSAVNFGVFRQYNGAQYTESSLSWYSIGTATDLAALDSAVSTLMEDLRSIDEQGFDRDALAYIRAVEAADGAYLETGVKKAINRFIVGCKKDGTWDALKASCILCGARTIAGALVPLAGTAPTGYGGWASGDYNRETGLVGNGTTKYLDSNRANSADVLEDKHVSVYSTAAPTLASALIGSSSSSPLSRTQIYYSAGNTNFAVNATSVFNSAASLSGTFAGVQIDGATMSCRVGGVSQQTSVVAVGHSPSTTVFARNLDGTAHLFTDARIAFYSIGSAISDLALLDARVTTLVSEIAAAIP